MGDLLTIWLEVAPGVVGVTIPSFDIVTRDVITRKNEVTRHPVEASLFRANPNVTDHVRKEPTTWEISGVLVDYPGGLEGYSGRALGLWYTLCRAQETQSFVGVSGPHDSITGAQITTLVKTRATSTGDCIEFTATIMEIFLASLGLVATAAPTKSTRVNTIKGVLAPKYATELRGKAFSSTVVDDLGISKGAGTPAQLSRAIPAGQTYESLGP